MTSTTIVTPPMSGKSFIMADLYHSTVRVFHRALLKRCIDRTTKELDQTRRHLEVVKERVRVKGPFANDQLTAQLHELRRQERERDEELAYLCFCRDRLNEKED